MEVSIRMEFMTSKYRKKFFREAGSDIGLALGTRPLRVRVYARVSTEHESQINALENQKEWYSLQIKSNWIFNPETDMYVDKGITGTQAKNRDAFLQMIEDAKRDDCDFDIIITREVSRFARNIEESFRYTRELREYGVGVYFISDNIWSFDDSADATIKFSIMSSLAQSESKKVSDRAKAGQLISRKNGQPYGNGNILGYDRVQLGKKKKKDIDPKTGLPYVTTFTYVINLEQAVTVRRIYELCLMGYGAKKIKKVLKEEGHLTATGKTNWQESTINRILNNPTYMGYNAYGKSEVVDYLSHEKSYQHDLTKLDLVKGDWEPIIPEETWYKALEERNKRLVVANKTEYTITKYGVPTSQNIWLRKLQCQCGTGFRRNKWRVNKLTQNKVYAYQCYNQVNNDSFKYNAANGFSTEGRCSVKCVQECSLELMAERICQLLVTSGVEAQKLAMQMVIENQSEEQIDNSNQIKQLNALIREEDGKVNAALMVAKGLIDEDILKKMYIEVDAKILDYKRKIDFLEEEQSHQLNKRVSLKNVDDFFSRLTTSISTASCIDILDFYLKRVICRDDSEFVWVFNFNEYNNLKPLERINHLSEEYRKTLRVDTNFTIIGEFEITVDEIDAYLKSKGRSIRKGKWKPLKVKIALGNKK